MESLYYVLSWACHRRCKHCYESRFRPYVRGALQKVVDEAKATFPKVIANLPDELSYLDLNAPSETAPGGYEHRASRIILAGGEVLVDPVREEVLYPALDAIREKYGAQGVRVIVQTTGDLVTPQIVEDLLARGAWMISCAGMDDFHVGMEGDKRLPLQDRLREMFEAAGMRDSALASTTRNWNEQTQDQPVYSFFGATEDAWIGKIWPRGRAWENSLSKATITDNFCNAWSGGLGFLNRGYSGSEVSIDPNGDVFPCCLKTAAPLGNLCEERLADILDSLTGHPAFEAISMGHPERMGLAQGWDLNRFLEESRTTRPDGQPYRNLCIGCDRYFEKVLGPELARLREARLAAKRAAE
ncbi:Iron-sulfur cluster-binding domain-containing protein [Roseovarius azorensis]|uniref:Iron-sulfur cluster-binding domain-containing protein n=1 Tax=Roseovarius azorensis TaxID=1287727 RepID=A0A1H7V276_9RHOB|nr:SPASM domain-containing protein [Roseovarius azorensis]SEM03253.1 Iron-sulfur cluster-binding domain-containing protein [Roseovarius azorensis]